MKKNFKLIIAIAVAVLLLIVVGTVVVMATTGANKDAYSSHMELAQQYLDELNYELAIAEYEAAIAIEPNNAEAYLALAEVYVQLEDYEAAVEVLERGIAQTSNADLATYLEKIHKDLRTAKDGTETDEMQSETPENQSGMRLQELLVLDDTYERYGYAYGGSIPAMKNGMWGAINYDGEVIVPFEYIGFYAAGDKLGNFVLYNSVITEETTEFGWTYTNESREYFLFDNEGNLLYQGEDEVRASGGMYITTHYYEEYIWMANIKYHRLDGSVLVSEECARGYVVPCGFYDGISNLNRIPETPILEGEEFYIGTVDQQGNLSWRIGTSYYIEEPRPVISTMNHGYYVTSPTYLIPEVLAVYDAQDNLVAELNCDDLLVDIEGNASIIKDNGYGDEYYSYRGFWVDGFYFWNYGSKMVFIVDGKNVLIDFARNTGDADSLRADEVVMAVYDYIAMADENYWLIRSGEQWGYIDHDGNEMALFQDASGFVGGYALVIEDGEVWLINETFEKLENLGYADSVVTMGELYSITIGEENHIYRLN